MKKFDNNTIEINGTVYELFDTERCICTNCDVESYCNKYELFKLCGYPSRKIFKKHTFCIEEAEYVAKINNDSKRSDCERCDIPKSTCMTHCISNRCTSPLLPPHVYFEYIGAPKKTLRNGKKDKKLEEKPKKRKFNPKNCQRSIKDQFTIGDITFTLTCHHSFEWTIAKTENGKITIEVYPNRNVAKKEFERKKELSK